MLDSAEAWIERLNLKPLPLEGGYYRETYRSDEALSSEGLPGRYGDSRACATAIYYLLQPGEISALHRLRTDEVYHFYAGDPVTMLQLYETGTGRLVRLGNSGDTDIEPQLQVPRRVWQGTSLEPGGRFALLGCTVAPGYEQSDFELGDRAALIEQYPKFKYRIMSLTRTG